MAAKLFNFSNTGANPFDIYMDAGDLLSPDSPSLPNGCCNYVDLTPGTNGAKCGCRRFWPRQTMSSPVPDQAGWCMCAHHACYHDDGPRDARDDPQHNAVQLPRHADFGPMGQENEKPRTGREPLNPVADTSRQAISAETEMDFAAFSPGVPLSFVNEFEPEAGDTPRQAVSPRAGGLIPDTLTWDEYLQSPPEYPGPSGHMDSSTLPHSRSQVPMASQTASTTSSTQARYQRPFAGKGLGTLNAPVPSYAKPPTGDMGSLCNPPQDTGPSNDSFVFVHHEEQGTAPPQSGTATQVEPRVAAACQGPSRVTFQNLSDTVSGHEQRLDCLETVSFSANGHAECIDKHDHMDLRVTELEQRMEGVEKAVDEADMVNKEANGEDDGLKSVVSEATTSVASRTNPDEMMAHIDRLKAQVSQLQSFLPSFGHAWTIEVVFLPFPLKRLWQELSHFNSDPTISNDDWTQTPMTLSSATMRSQSPFGGDWAASDHDAEWLYPRACRDTSTQDRRLRSRGLVQNVSFHGPDARSVQAAIHQAFDPVFRIMDLTPRRQTTDPRASKYLGLQETWVPLRKVHKDSRLRFLSAAEMLTPAAWDVNFLHSAAMKSAKPRLFITHADAYMQDYEAYESGWAWQRIREMDRVSPDVSESQEIKEADAMEHCWLWNDQLDEAPSASTSLSMRQDRQPVSSSPALTTTSAQPWRSFSPFAVRGPSPMVSGHRAPRPPHIRTASVPIVPATTTQSPASAGRRRIVSHGQSRHSSPFTRGPSFQGIQKRHRTRSPSNHHYTPRWTSSPSPMPSGLHDRQLTRGMTPLAYATPYSNAPLQELRPLRGSSVARSGTSHAPLEYAADELFEVGPYDSSSDESYREDDTEESTSSGEIVTHVAMDSRDSSRQAPLPEDEPWPGVEDEGLPPSDGENVDPTSPQEGQSQGSSQPSEYPSTQRAWPGDNSMGFHIHEDEE